MLFAFKKYVPKDFNYIDELYKRFVDEIKILFTISHPNIVRVYNYYLYPEIKHGYLQMEYIEGGYLMSNTSLKGDAAALSQMKKLFKHNRTDSHATRNRYEKACSTFVS